MGNMSNGEKIGIVILGILLSPFYLAKQALEWMGIIAKPNYEYDPSKDPNYVEPPPPQE
jgi:hypothetical protein